VRKTLMLSVILLIATVSLPAQDSANTTGKTGDLITVEGCLQHAEGQYTLVDSTNTLHHLTGGGSKLGHLIGREVEVTGKLGTRTLDTTAQGTASNVVIQQIIAVKSVKQTADTCK
jgi:hypothetical protein